MIIIERHPEDRTMHASSAAITKPLQRVAIVTATAAGTVTSDTTCTPDGEGLSHCHNDIDLDNGARITVVHHHAMLQHPCLTPGERVTLRGVTASWIVVRASGVRHAPITTP